MGRSSIAARFALLLSSFFVYPGSGARAAEFSCPAAISASGLADASEVAKPAYPLTMPRAARLARQTVREHPRPALEQADFAEAAVATFLNAIDPRGYLVLSPLRDALAAKAKALDPQLASELQFGIRDGAGPLASAARDAEGRLNRLIAALAAPEAGARVLAVARAPSASANGEDPIPSAPATDQQAEQRLVEQIAAGVRVWLEKGFTPEESVDFVMRLAISDLQGRRHLISDAGFPSALLAAFMGALDAHSGYVPPSASAGNRRTQALEDGYVGLGVTLGLTPRGCEFAEIAAGSGAERAGLRAGDRILTVNGRDLSKAMISEIVEALTGPAGQEVNLEIQRGPDRLAFKAIRTRVQPPPRTAAQVFALERPGASAPMKLGAVRLSVFGQGAGIELLREVARIENEIDGLVLDFRGNGGGSLPEALAILRAFLPPGPMLFMSGSQPVGYATQTPPRFRMPLIVLVDGYSASASELVAGALQARRRALVVGSRSFGKGTYQTHVPLPLDRGLAISTRGYFFFADGRTPQNVGVTPDIEIAGAERLGRREESLPRALPATQGPRFVSSSPESDARWNAAIAKLREQAESRRFVEGNEPTPAGYGIEGADRALPEALRVLGDFVDYVRSFRP